MNSAVKVLKSSPRPISEIISEQTGSNNEPTIKPTAKPTVKLTSRSTTESTSDYTGNAIDESEISDFDTLCPTGDGYRNLAFTFYSSFLI
jgi:hypothetical protein